MNGTELLRVVCVKEGIDFSVATTVLRAFLDGLMDTLLDGQGVTIRGLGRFDTHTRAPTTRHNPATGAVVHVPEQRVLSFYASHKLREMLNETPDD